MQDILVYFIVAASAAYLARSAWKSATGKKSCCGSGCGPKKAAQPELIQISLGGKPPVR